jgi:adenine-specific DNA-methyltransferase
MKEQPSYTKLRGGYYTPEVIAQFLAGWAIRSQRDEIIEPSCGDGVFLEAATRTLCGLGAKLDCASRQIRGYEIDGEEAAKSVLRLQSLGVEKSKAQVFEGDFFASAVRLLGLDGCDVVLGNPPFVRYQNFPEAQRKVAFEIMRGTGLRPSRLTNAWVPFLVAGALLLRPGGRMAMVLPAELLQVNYAAELRLFLSKFFKRITAMTFRKLAFPGIQQEVILLLAEREAQSQGGIEVVELDGIPDLSKYRQSHFGRNGFKAIDHSTEKWTQYFLTAQELDLIRGLRRNAGLVELGTLGETDIGVVTGMNDFFVLTAAEIEQLKLEKYARRLVSRSNQLSGIIFKGNDWREKARAGMPVHLLDLPALDILKLPAHVRGYIAAGEAAKLHLGYKCRIRRFWYRVPSVYDPTGFLLRQVHGYPKLVVNKTAATSTDTVHRVRFKKDVNGYQVAAAFLNSLTFAFAEISGRSYGGGVLEIEPNEADRLPIPLAGSTKLDVEEIDCLVRAGEIEKVLEITDRELLVKGLGLTTRQSVMLNEIWKKLRDRRQGRKDRSAAMVA